MCIFGEFISIIMAWKELFWHLLGVPECANSMCNYLPVANMRCQYLISFGNGKQQTQPSQQKKAPADIAGSFDANFLIAFSYGKAGIVWSSP